MNYLQHETQTTIIMALPLQAGLTPMEVAFLCEMEMVTVVPRQRLESLNLLSVSSPPFNPSKPPLFSHLSSPCSLQAKLTFDLQGPTPILRPPHRAPIPLWLALLLKRQRRANILPPPWLLSSSLERILKYETETSPLAFSPPPPHPHPVTSRSSATDFVSPPFLPSSTADAPPDYLPYHWLELGEILLEAASDDVPEPDRVRGLLRDLREVRMSKMRGSIKGLEGEGGGVSKMTGVGAMEVAEGRGFIVGVLDGLRRLGSSREVARREREAEEGGEGSEDEEMGFE